MATKSMGWYVANNDFEGAMDRWATTSARWKKEWFGICKTIFDKSKEWAKTYILNPIEYTIQKVSQIKTATKRVSKYADKIQVANGVDLLDNAKEKCYLFTFFDEEDNLVCSKVGTTTRTVLKRLREELRSKTYIRLGCVRAVVNRVYDCGDIPAEGLESYFRAMYIRKHPQSFLKNDRFMNEWFDLKEADEIVLNYFA
jgi:hypothetical protein